jgi:hypothetical protein
MIEWLLMPVDPARAHDVGLAVAWHGRLMTLGWGVLIPLGVVIARYFKVTPRQDWPRELDNLLWWRGHLACQYLGGIAMLAGFGLILTASGGDGGAWPHRSLGYVVLGFGALQFVAGWLRGSKGGPTEANPRGDHYDMTLRRIIFEGVHKSVGYLALAFAAAAILTGLWAANAPRWMPIVMLGWWIGLIGTAVRLQLLGRYKSSYHAIWGPDPAHPGNRR